MHRHLYEFPIPFSVAISFALVVMGGVVGAINPSEVVRRLGWALAVIAVASLFIGLTRVLWQALMENRMQFMSRAARDMIDDVTDLDREWKTINEEEQR